MTFLKNNKVTFIQLGVWLLLLGLTALIGKESFGWALNSSIDWTICYLLLALAMIATIKTSAGLNFGVPIGIVCGYFAVILAIQFSFTGFGWLAVSIVLALLFSALAGFGYGKLLGRVKGSGGTNLMLTFFIGVAAVAIMNFICSIISFGNSANILPGETGLRMPINVGSSTRILSSFLQFNLGKVSIPLGLILIQVAVGFAVWYFLFREKGIVADERAEATTVTTASKNKEVTAAMISTAIGSLFAVVYVQNMGTINAYTDITMYTIMPVAAAIFLGGVSLKKATVSQVVMGVLLFSGLWVLLSQPGSTFDNTSLADALWADDIKTKFTYIRALLQYAIITYAIIMSFWRRNIYGQPEDK